MISNDGNYINYLRNKTTHLIGVSLSVEAKTIMECYWKKGEPRVFTFLYTKKKDDIYCSE